MPAGSWCRSSSGRGARAPDPKTRWLLEGDAADAQEIGRAILMLVKAAAE
jgi:hypothetical protein